MLRFAIQFGCSIEFSTKEIAQYVESKSKEVDATLNNNENNYIKFPFDLVPVIDGEFLTAHPNRLVCHKSELSQEAKEFFSTIDFMAGITSGEGAMNIQPLFGVYHMHDFAPAKEEFEKTDTQG